jgi:tetratricopeptide (TPR) repeat protein
MTARGAGTGRKCRFVAMLALTVAAAAVPALAQPGGASTSPTPVDAQQKAEAHYKRARELYGSGAYREAAAELEAARGLDPNAKELVFNLGVVSEKLGKFDDALRYFRLYTTMDGVTDQEKQRAEAAIKRLEGAKRETPTPQPSASASTTPTPPPPETPPTPPEKGRIDAATVVAASVAIVGLGVGTTFGIKALADKPKSSFVTGRDGSYDDLQSKASSAHREAVVADVGLGVGVVAAAITAYLYFARPKVTTTPSPRAQVWGSPMPGGGALVVQGTF